MHQGTQKGPDCACSPASGSFSSSWYIRCMRAPRCHACESRLTHPAGAGAHRPQSESGLRRNPARAKPAIMAAMPTNATALDRLIVTIQLGGMCCSFACDIHNASYHCIHPLVRNQAVAPAVMSSSVCESVARTMRIAETDSAANAAAVSAVRNCVETMSATG